MPGQYNPSSDLSGIDAYCLHSAYTEAVANSVPGNVGTSSGSDTGFAATTGPLRMLAVAGAASKLARLHQELTDRNHGTLVHDISKYRNAKRDLSWMVDLIRHPTEPKPKTRIDEIAYMVDGSPLARYILGQIRDYVLADEDKPEKLLIAEDTPLVAWFWELLIQWTYVGASVMHSALSNEDRQKLVVAFNDPNSDLLVLIIMYLVGSQGTNLDGACRRCVVATPGINAPMEVQAWGRIIRVSRLVFDVYEEFC